MSEKHSLEFNKLAAGVLLAGVLAMIAGFTADYLYHPKEPKERGFAVDVPEESATGAAVVEEVEVPIAELLATADVASGEKIFKRKCASCHTVDAGGGHKTGPNLHKIAGAKVAGKSGYPYSKSLKEVGGKWDDETLNKWTKNPRKVASGSKMVLKVKKDAERADIVKYLKSLK